MESIAKIRGGEEGKVDCHLYMLLILNILNVNVNEEDLPGHCLNWAGPLESSQRFFFLFL